MLSEKSWDKMPLHSITQLSAGSGKVVTVCPSCIAESNTSGQHADDSE